MREIRRTSGFQRDFKRESAGRYSKTLDSDLLGIVELLAVDLPLPQRCHDHALVGEWADFRDCHIRPDLVLIYRKTDDNFLDLVRLGSHSELRL
jgi:mRNA interferase YafQ